MASRYLEIWVEVTHKVIENGIIREIAYEFLLAFHSNYGAILIVYEI